MYGGILLPSLFVGGKQKKKTIMQQIIGNKFLEYLLLFYFVKSAVY